MQECERERMKKDVLIKINKWYYKNTVKNVKMLAKKRTDRKKKRKITNKTEENA